MSKHRDPYGPVTLTCPPKKHNRYSFELKAKVALATQKNEEAISELSTRFGVHPRMINSWK
ncbi:MAG: transposase [Desulfatiglandales bacterium]